MMRVTFPLSPDVLSWIMAQIRYDALPAKITENLQQWAAGVKQPTFNQIEAASRATSIPIGYFFLKTPPVEDVSLARYRTIDSVELKHPSRNLIDTIHDMELVQEWAKGYLISQNAGELSYVGNKKTEQSVSRFADYIRCLLNLNIDWYKNMSKIEESFRYIRNLISEAGTLVMMSGVVGSNTHRSLEINEFRAFTIVDKYAPLIFINAADSYSGRLFSLIHEFTHIVIGENSLYNDRTGNSMTEKKRRLYAMRLLLKFLFPSLYFLWSGKQQCNKPTLKKQSIF